MAGAAPVLAAGCAAVLATTFAVSAASKIADHAAFARTVTSALGVRDRPARLLATAVVAAEVLTAVLLLVGLWLRPAGLTGFVAAAVLLVAFTAVLAAMIRRGAAEPCRCFGQASSRPPGRGDLVRNAVLLTVAVAGAVLVAAAAELRSLASAGVVAGALGGVAVAVMLINLDELTWLFSPSQAGSG